MDFEISISIVEWNRSAEFKALLDSIVSQITEDIRDKVEICVSDDASTEDIKSIIDEYRKKHPHIKYFCFEKNAGVDLNYLKAVEIASAPFCWAFGNDDLMLDGALKYILKEIRENPDIDIFMGELVSFTDFEDKVFYRGGFRISKPTKDFVFENGNTRCILLFSHIGEAIVKKEMWNRYSQINWHSDNETDVWDGRRFVGTLDVHLYVMFSMIKNGSKLKSLIKPIVAARSFAKNDPFMIDGIRKRWIYCLESVKKIPEAVFGKNSKEAKWMASHQLIYTEICTIRAGKTGAFPMNTKLYIALFKDLYHYFPKNLLLYFYVLPCMLIPSFVYKAAIMLYRKTLKKKKIVKIKLNAMKGDENNA